MMCSLNITFRFYAYCYCRKDFKIIINTNILVLQAIFPMYPQKAHKKQTLDSSSFSPSMQFDFIS